MSADAIFITTGPPMSAAAAAACLVEVQSRSSVTEMP